MRAKTVNEDQNFERGQDPKAAMGLGGINFQETFDELFDEWALTLYKLNGKIITADMTKHWMDNGMPQHESGDQTVKIKSLDQPDVESMGGGHAASWKCYFDGDDGFRYSMLLNQKIYVK